jgi:predicted alpha/beta superfamily hydrolase
MKILNLAGAFVLCVTLGSQAAGAADRPTAVPSEATIYSTRSFDLVSKFNGESYRVKIAIPRDAPPKAGFPVLYVVDGDLFFGTLAGAVWNEGKSSELTQTVVVGIESGPAENGADRTLDFTPLDLSAYEKKVVVDLGENPKFGGYDKFIRTVQEEIKPRVGKLVDVDKNHEAVFGWSLGGQFVIHTMLAHPDYFSCYLALSPAIWRSDRAVLKEIPAFEKDIAASGKRVSLFVGVGSLEEQLSPGMMQWPVDQAKLTAEMKYARMVGNVKDFTSEIQPFFAKQGMAFESRIFEGETHNTAPWAAVNPMLRFAFPLDHPK